MNSYSEIPLSDLESSAQEKNPPSSDALSFHKDATTLLHHINTALSDLEADPQVLPEAIQRGTKDLAHIIGNVGREIQAHDQEERREWCRAVIQDSHLALRLEQQQQEQEATRTQSGLEHKSEMVPSTSTVPLKMMRLQEEELIKAIDLASSLLLDVEESLLQITKQDAEELASVGLLVARLFVGGLEQSLHQLNWNNPREGQTLDVEYIHDKDAGDDEEASPPPRMRCLWPPIGPHVASAASWSAENAIQNPIVSIALAFALWPAALVGALLGGPLLMTDWVLQSTYEKAVAQEEPWVTVAEVGLANGYNVVKFHLLVGKLALKQGIRVGQRQVERRGGVGNVVKDVGGWTVERVTRPVETAGMVWGGMVWGANAVKNGFDFAKEMLGNQQRMEQGLNGLET